MIISRCARRVVGEITSPSGERSVAEGEGEGCAVAYEGKLKVR